MSRENFKPRSSIDVKQPGFALLFCFEHQENFHESHALVIMRCFIHHVITIAPTLWLPPVSTGIPSGSEPWAEIGRPATMQTDEREAG
jgi:hypothetical protein